MPLALPVRICHGKIGETSNGLVHFEAVAEFVVAGAAGFLRGNRSGATSAELPGDRRRRPRLLRHRRIRQRDRNAESRCARYIAIIGTGLAIYHYTSWPRHVYTERDPYDAETEPFDEPSEFEQGGSGNEGSLSVTQPHFKATDGRHSHRGCPNDAVRSVKARYRSRSSNTRRAFQQLPK